MMFCEDLASGFGQPASSIPQPDRTMGLPPELMSTPQPTLPPASTPTPNPVTGGLGRPSSEPAWSDTGVRPRYEPTRRPGDRTADWHERVSNPTLSQTDDVVNRIHEAERNLKDVRRDQWLEMNRASASNVLASIGSELPSHLAEVSNPARKALADRLSTPNPGASGPDPALMQRMAEVAVRRVARKRGVTVETPSARIEGENATVTVTYIDDGRVLDDPETLRSAFERAVTTELALKGMDVTVSIDLSRQKDGAVESLGSAEDEDVEMYACDACNGLVKATDPSCPHCGAMFDDGEEEQQPTEQEAPPREPPGGPSRGPPGDRARDHPEVESRTARRTEQGTTRWSESRTAKRTEQGTTRRTESRTARGTEQGTTRRTESRTAKWTEQGTTRRSESRATKWTEQGTTRRTESRTAKWTGARDHGRSESRTARRTGARDHREGPSRGPPGGPSKGPPGGPSRGPPEDRAGDHQEDRTWTSRTETILSESMPSVSIQVT